jgi:Putative phage tail protein
MASIGVSAAATAYAWNPFLAAGAIAVASYLDQQFLYPSLLGDGKQQAKPRPLVGLPTTTNTPGSPRVWAIGRRLRVPLHVMYQSEKTREDTISGPKGGVAGVIKRVFADVGLSINDRPTARLTQLVANGQLVYWSDKNLVRVTTDQMSGTFTTTTVATGTVAAGSTTTVVNSVAGGMVVNAYGLNYRWLQITSGPLSGQARPINSNTVNAFTVDWAFGAAPVAGVTYSVIEKRLVLTMNSSYEPDFADYLKVNNVVDLRGFSSTPSGSYIAGRTKPTKSWWLVTSVTPHSSTPSSITLEAIGAQDIGPLTSVQAGTAFAPASVVREDDIWHWIDGTMGAGASLVNTLDLSSLSEAQRAEAIQKWLRFMGTSSSFRVNAYNWIGGGSPTNWIASNAPSDITNPYIRPRLGTNFATALSKRCVNDAPYIERVNTSGFEPRMFAASPTDSFYQGTEEQTQDDILARRYTGGQIPGFRGLSYQLLDQWDLSTYFGNQVPPIVEAIIEPDAIMSLENAIMAICQRAEAPDIKFDTAGVDLIPFEGYWTQGAIPTVTALQPVLTAYQVAVQERNDTVAFFNIENADVIQIENGAAFSDLGVQSGSDTPSAGDKLRITQRDTADLPTSIGVSHQDPDQQYAQGYQHFKQRQPSELASANEQNVQLDNLVLTRKQARNLAGTMMRRAWVNATALEFQLPIAYCELLENDLVTLTDDEGMDYTARVIRREIGNNYVVNCYAVVEDVNLEVRGSPVQGPSEIVIGTPEPVVPTGYVLDIPPLVDEDAFVPGYYVAACSPGGDAWNGATVYESRDSGNTWQQVTVLNTECGIGTLFSTLPSGTPSDGIGSVTWDTVNSFTVAIDDFGPLGAPVTMTEPDVLDGWNWMLIQDGSNFEIVGARDVVDNGDGTFTFDYLLRGLRGTYDSSATTKAIGSRVTFLFGARQQEAIKFIPLNVSAATLPLSLQIKFVPPGASLVDVTAQSVTINAWNARPMPGRMFSTDLDLATYDRTFTFAPWTRLQTPVGYGGPAAGYTLDETFEGYSVRIYDPTGATLMRTKTISSGPTGANRLRGLAEFVYTAAEQTTDGYTPGPSEMFKVERVQLGDFGEGRSWMEDV